MPLTPRVALLETMTVYSVGGGVIEIEGEDAAVHAPCYPHHTLDEIKAFCAAEHIGLNAYVDQFDDSDISSYLNEILIQMLKTVDAGLNASGILPGRLKLDRIGPLPAAGSERCARQRTRKAAAVRLCLCRL